MRTAGVANDSAAASYPGLAPDHTGFIHFHSSTTSGSACLMSFRILLRVSPRQSPNSAILCDISCDAAWPWLAPDFSMFSSSKGLNAELLCVLRVQSLPAAELHRLGTNDAADGGSAEKVIQNIETNVPPGSTHRDEAAIDVGPQREARAATKGFFFSLSSFSFVLIDPCGRGGVRRHLRERTRTYGTEPARHPPPSVNSVPAG